MDPACKKFLSKHPELHFVKDVEKVRVAKSAYELTVYCHNFLFSYCTDQVPSQWSRDAMSH